MKLLASLIIALCLCLGCFAAAQAYVRPVTTISADEQLTLNAPAGLDPDDPSKPLLSPQADEAVVLDQETLDRLRDHDVAYVRVKEFKPLRWRLNWLFALSVIGLVAGAVIIRRERARELAAATQHIEDRAMSPAALLDSVLKDLSTLNTEIADGAIHPHELAAEIISRIDDMQSNALLPFVEARSLLIGQLGMAGYAQLMDAFAGAERELNRAWSAAADNVLDEAVECLKTSQSRFEETHKRLA